MFKIKRHRPETGHRVHKILGFWLEGAHQRANLKKSRCFHNLEYEDLTFSGRFITPELVSQCTIATRVYATPEVKYLGNLALTWKLGAHLDNLEDFYLRTSSSPTGLVSGESRRSQGIPAT